MSYGNIGGWPVQFGQPQQSYQQNQQSFSPQPMRREIVRVNGADGIKAFQLNPLESVIAIDDTEPNVFWVKVMDAAGFPTLKRAHFKFDDESVPQNTEYVSKKDFDVLAEKFDKLMEELGNGKSDK